MIIDVIHIASCFGASREGLEYPFSGGSRGLDPPFPFQGGKINKGLRKFVHPEVP